MVKAGNGNYAVKIPAKIKLANVHFEKIELGILRLRQFYKLRTKINPRIINIMSLFFQVIIKSGIAAPQIQNTRPIGNIFAKKIKMKKKKRGSVINWFKKMETKAKGHCEGGTTEAIFHLERQLHAG